MNAAAGPRRIAIAPRRVRELPRAGRVKLVAARERRRRFVEVLEADRAFVCSLWSSRRAEAGDVFPATGRASATLCRRRAGAPVDRSRKRHRWRWRRRRCFGPLSFDFLIFSLLEILFRFPLALLGAGFAHPHFILFFGAHHLGTRATATNSAVTVPAEDRPGRPPHLYEREQVVLRTLDARSGSRVIRESASPCDQRLPQRRDSLLVPYRPLAKAQIRHARRPP